MASHGAELEPAISEELFDFDELAGSIAVDAEELNAALDSVLGVLSPDDTPDEAQAAPPAVFVPYQSPPPLAPTRARPPLETGPLAAFEPDPVLPSAALAAPAAPQARRLALAPAILIALGAIALLNLALLGRVAGSLRDLADRGSESAAPPQGSAAVEPHASEPRLAEPEPALAVEVEPEVIRALERAREALELGEHERARQILFALLAVADRIPPLERRRIEAQARLLVADTWRLEAEGRAAEEAAQR